MVVYPEWRYREMAIKKKKKNIETAIKIVKELWQKEYSNIPLLVYILR